MEFKLINFLPENWLNALGTTLFHSLWLGVVLAVFAGAVMFFTRETSAKIRYNLLTVCLLLFVVAIVTTFGLELSRQSNALSVELSNEVEINVLKLQSAQASVSAAQFNVFSGLNKILGLWNSYSYQIVMIWFLIICGKSIQLLVGLNGIYHLRNNQVFAAGNTWDEHLDLLSEKLGLNQQVKMMQSGIAKVPMVVGHFKPLILIPLGLLNGLSTTEVEAILAHELAHIKRRDYLVNLLQSFIEIVFFFNPAVLWVSQLIKTEREHCCDDLAIACVNDRKNYVKALIFCQEFKQRAPAYAMGITGKNGSLLHRASRMLLNTNSTLNKMEKTILTIALVSTVLCAAAFKTVSHAVASEQKFTSILTLQDTAKKSKSADQIEKEIEQKMKAAERKNQSLKKADLGETVLKQDQLDAKKIELEAKRSATDRKNAEDEKRYAESEKKFKETEKKFAAEELKFANEEKKWAEEDAKWAKKDKEWAEQDKKMQEGNGKGSRTPRAPRPPRPPRLRSSAVPPVPPAPSSAVPATPPAPPTPPRINGSLTFNEGNTVNIKVENGKDNTDKISAQLLKDGLVSNTTNLSFSLDKNSMIVNGVKQSERIHKKYQEKYLESASQTLSYVRVDKVTRN